MAIRKALLTQDASELIKLIGPMLEKAVEAFMHHQVEPMSALQWILEKELEEIYGIVSKNHDRNHEPNVRVYQYLNELYEDGLSGVVGSHVGAPFADPDHVVELEVDYYDIRIRYVPEYKSFLQLRTPIRQFNYAHVKPKEILFGPQGNGGTTVLRSGRTV